MFLTKSAIFIQNDPYQPSIKIFEGVTGDPSTIKLLGEAYQTSWNEKTNELCISSGHLCLQYRNTQKTFYVYSTTQPEKLVVFSIKKYRHENSLEVYRGSIDPTKLFDFPPTAKCIVEKIETDKDAPKVGEA